MSRNKIKIPIGAKFPKPKFRAVRNIHKKVAGKESGSLIDNTEIDSKKLAMLININHLLANVNWLFTIDMSDMIKETDPTLCRMLSHPVERIREHASAMMSVIDDGMGEEFSEGFEELTFSLKELIYEYVKGKRGEDK